MHMLCLIMYKVRSENGYGFLRPGLKTGVGNGIFFGLKLGLDLEMRAAHTHQKFQAVPPPPPQGEEIKSRESSYFFEGLIIYISFKQFGLPRLFVL